MPNPRPFRIAPPGASPPDPEPEPPPPPGPPRMERGRLLEAQEVAIEFYHGQRSRRWVLDTLHHCRAKIPGQRVLFWEALVCSELGLPFEPG
jgi:hypothetical protein